ncbi:hypothetical protein VNO77_37322 [Canavalia gladiata]|uniref:Uncharacterized protein n=1 Tax=Canavalia gladiata TaxID=3824 RepID=A0AAN9K8R2_CANGL
MSVSATSSLAPPTPNASSNFSRRSANYHPSVWGDCFIQYDLKPTEVDEIMKKNIMVLKEKVRKMLILKNGETLRPLKMANLIDSIQRLGVYYHFEHEINVFKKFMNEDGNFNERLTMEVEGMLSLYEAAHIRTHGEDILDEAIVFTFTHLKLMRSQLSPSFVAKINYSLKRPLLKNMPRLVAKHYISTYEEHSSDDQTLLLFAKLDFNMLQKQHQKEVGNVSKWWKDLDVATKFPFTRDRLVETYFWTLGVYFEPQFSLGRRLMTKVISMSSIIDDIYDVYGTFEELQLFTDAIERWDINCINFLPKYMKFCYQALLDVFKEIEQEMDKQGRAFCAIYAKNEIKRLVQAYFAEAKWMNSNYTPTMEEYMAVAQVSSGYRVLTIMAFLGMGCIVTEKEFQWFSNDPKIIDAATKISRLMDDIVSSEFEQKREHVSSALGCYMKQHGATKCEAVDELHKQITSAWKDINEEYLDPTKVPRPLLTVVLNLSRVMDVLYKDADGYTHSNGSTKNNIATLLLNPWPVQE